VLLGRIVSRGGSRLTRVRENDLFRCDLAGGHLEYGVVVACRYGFSRSPITYGCRGEVEQLRQRDRSTKCVDDVGCGHDADGEPILGARQHSFCVPHSK
jgi:hypothetical protein